MKKLKRLYYALIYHPIDMPPFEGYYIYKITRFCYKLIEMPWFNSIIIILIIFNTILLATDSYPLPPADFIFASQILNYVFTAIFALETVLKIVGLGIKNFSKDKFNIFDAIVVLLSLVELSLDSNSSISALRAFRLFRIIKLARSWKSLKLLIYSIAHTIAAIGNFTVLLGLFIYVYSLLGMQFFAGKLKFNKEGYYDPNGESPREHFDHLGWAFLTIFSILVGDNWNEVMYNCIRSVGFSSSIYFVFLVVLGNFILLNLFLAILLGNFDEANELMY